MFKQVFKSAIALVIGAVVSVSLYSCSDDDDETTETSISIDNASFNTYQPEGFVKVNVKVSDPNAQLSVNSFQINKFSYTSSSSLDEASIIPSIKMAYIKKEAQGYSLYVSYNLNGLHGASAKFTLAYDYVELPGEISIDMKRAHVFDKRIMMSGNLENIDAIEFPVFDFLDKLNVKHMDVKEIGVKGNLFLSKNRSTLYPALTADKSKLYFENVESTAEGKIVLSGMHNAAYGQPYSMINKIKLAQPDKDGNEYIWLEFPFGFKPEGK